MTLDEEGLQRFRLSRLIVTRNNEETKLKV